MSQVDKQALLTTDKHANQHMLSRLIVEANSAELRAFAESVEQYIDRLIAALEAAEKRIAGLATENADLKHPGTYLPSKISAPMTDAFINEMRAQGMNGFIEFLKQRAREFPQSVVANSLDVITNNAEQYAYSQQLRKESGK
ncbi:hypothetical protein DCF75_11195 [Edwardsiella tarda]|uniref:hypothetical protein n=1 Tax=Edwardsiella tarda TaxID=636 RepID=UPI001CF300B1|nr:hypothetical protein [Edwardsiella tarda]UCQ53315.1 hypothetical protein DCF75_11195 [Edwardsiella tarda]